VQDRVRFSPDRIKWLYARGFGRGTTMAVATDGTQKIGQVAMIGQTARESAGDPGPASRCQTDAKAVRLDWLSAHRFRFCVRAPHDWGQGSFTARSGYLGRIGCDSSVSLPQP